MRKFFLQIKIRSYLATSPNSDSHASLAQSNALTHAGYHRPRKFRYNIPSV